MKENFISEQPSSVVKTANVTPIHANVDVEETVGTQCEQEVTETNGSLKAYTINELLGLDLPERGHVLSPWLPEKGLAMVYAPAGVGKTLFSLNVAYAVATGGAFLGWQATTPRSVLYIDGEMAAKDMQDRLKAIKGKATPDYEIPLTLLTPELLSCSMPNLSTPGGQAAISHLVDDAEFIVVDNIACLCPTGSENETESWRPVQQWLLDLKRKGKAVLLVHHSSKNGSQRGTSARQDVLDTVVSLTRPKGYKASQGAAFNIAFTKGRGFYGDSAADMYVSLKVDDDSCQHWEYRVIGAELVDYESGNQTYQKVVELYNAGKKQADIAKEVSRDRSVVSRYVKEAKINGDIIEAESATPSSEIDAKPFTIESGDTTLAEDDDDDMKYFENM